MKTKKIEREEITELLVRMLSIAFGVMCPYVTMYLLDDVVEAQSKSLLVKTMIVFAAVFFGDVLVDLTATIIQIIWGEKIALKHRIRLFNSYIGADYRNTEKENIGKAITVFSSDIKGYADLKSKYYPVIISDALYMICIAGCMLSISAGITCVVLILFFAMCYINMRLKRRIEGKSLRIQKSNDKCIDFFEKSMRMTASIKTNNAEELFADKMENAAKELADSRKSGTIFVAVLNSASTFAIAMMQGLIYFWGISRVIKGAFTVGKIVALIQYFRLVSGPFYEIINTLILKKSVQPMKARIDEIENLPKEITGEKEIDEIGSIEISDVGISLGNRVVLENVNIRFPKSGVALIEGETGSGKSTICKMLTGLYHPDKGSILINGTDIRQCSMQSIRERIAYVPQFPDIVSGSFCENIAFLQKDVSREAVEEISEKVRLHDRIMKEENGFDAVIEDRSNLSGGEIQLVALARAMLKHPDVIVLDEPLASLDENSAKIICSLINELSQRMLVVLISHGRCSDVSVKTKIEVKNGTVYQS